MIIYIIQKINYINELSGTINLMVNATILSLLLSLLIFSYLLLFFLVSVKDENRLILKGYDYCFGGKIKENYRICIY